MEWLRHTIRLNDGRIPKKAVNLKLGGRRYPVRWFDDNFKRFYDNRREHSTKDYETCVKMDDSLVMNFYESFRYNVSLKNSFF